MSSQKTVLITGASSGIGLELARLFAHDGCNLVVVARNKTALDQLAAELQQKYSVDVAVFTCDLSDRAQVVQLTIDVAQKNIIIDILVNNAGIGQFGKFIETDVSAEENMISLNIAALTYLTKFFAKKMVAQGEGKVLNVASIAGFMPGPFMAVYYATKAYVLSFSEALANELRGTGVQVSVLCPGATRSGFQKAAGMDSSPLFESGPIPSSAEVAREGYRQFCRGKTVIVTGFLNRVLVQLLRIAPRAFVTAYVRRYQEIK